MNQPSNKQKDGISVQEIENFGKKYLTELVFIIYFLLAAFFSSFFFGPRWCLYLAAVGGILGAWLFKKCDSIVHKALRFTCKQEKVTRMVFCLVGFIVAIFLPPLFFFLIGVCGGCCLLKHVQAVGGNDKFTQDQ